MLDIDPSMMNVILAMQEMPRDLPGEVSPIGPGNAGDAEGPPAQQGNPMTLLWLMAIFVFVILFMSIMGNRRERKKREQLIASVKKHDKVQTIGGVIGSIVELKPDFVVLKVDESSNTRITFARSAIQQVIKSSNAGKKEKEVEQPQE